MEQRSGTSWEDTEGADHRKFQSVVLAHITATTEEEAVDVKLYLSWPRLSKSLGKLPSDSNEEQKRVMDLLQCFYETSDREEQNNILTASIKNTCYKTGKN